MPILRLLRRVESSSACGHRGAHPHLPDGKYLPALRPECGERIRPKVAPPSGSACGFPKRRGAANTSWPVISLRPCDLLTHLSRDRPPHAPEQRRWCAKCWLTDTDRPGAFVHRTAAQVASGEAIDGTCSLRRALGNNPHASPMVGATFWTMALATIQGEGR